MARKKTSADVTGASVAPLTEKGLVPLLGSRNALSKIPGDGGTVARENNVTLVTGRPYATSERVVPTEEIYFVEGAKPSEPGPWIGEADKLAWRDPASGFDCIVLRDTDGGFLSGYVGVPKDHPLWGWDEEAVTSADLGIEVHGGLNYSAICRDGPSPRRTLSAEATRICHVPLHSRFYQPVEHASDYRVEDAHAWWFGFSCDQIYDLVPKARAHRQRFLAAEVAAEYRDDGYVVREVLNLAAQLRAVADGKPAPIREGPPLPSVGLDPQKGGRPW